MQIFVSRMKKIIGILLISIPLLAKNTTLELAQHEANTQPTISFTFDDGKTSALGGYPLQVWHGRILSALEKHRIKAIMFVAGHNKKTANGKYVLSTWNNAGHWLANHTLNHPNFNNDAVTLDAYKSELLLNDSIIRKYSNYLRYFRFPYLKEGNTPEKVAGFRAFMKALNYKHGHVSIDCSDWYIDSRLRSKLEADPQTNIDGFRSFYLQHIYEKAVFYDSLSLALTGRHVQHSLLLHHNLAAGLFLDDLITYFKRKGWKVMDADKVYNDPFFQLTTNVIPAGESHTWSLAKQSGKFEHKLRYPAEGDQYEKEKMDALGL